MYFKLALKNVKKSYRDYLIYFLTLAFSVCLFYTFNSFQAQQAVLEANSPHELSESLNNMLMALNLIMNILSIFVSVILAFLIIYANNFLIKQRKKELAIYTLLGMQKNKISKILIYETFIIGLISLIIGLGLGLLLSQVLLVVTANFFEVILNYQFIYSSQATLFTILAFSTIFIIIILFNTYSLNKYKLIDLIHADRKQEELKVKSTTLFVFIFLLSLIFLGTAYYIILEYSFYYFESVLASIICGSIGTVLFFFSLSGFLLRFIQTSKSLYFRKLNMFVLRQINKNINSNFLSMSIVCIMLLLSIGALSTGFSLNSIISQTVKSSTPYHYTYLNYFRQLDLPERIKELPIDYDTYIQKQTFLQEYSLDNGLQQIAPFITTEKDSYEVSNFPLEIIPLSKFNELRQQYKLSPISLGDNEAYLFTSSTRFENTIYEVLQAKPTINVFDHEVTITNDSFGSTNTFNFTLVVADEYIPASAPKDLCYWNVTLKDGISSSEFEKYMLNLMNSFNEKQYEQLDQDNIESLQSFIPLAEYMGISDTTVKESYNGLTVVYTYIGLYLGTVFLIASTVILALQQLSQANDNKKRYLTLHKIGAEQRMISQSIFLQLAIYFFIPLLLSIVHSFVGIKAVNSIIIHLGKGDIFMSSLFTALIILIVYGSYFFVTYFGYKRILKQS